MLATIARKQQETTDSPEHFSRNEKPLECKHLGNEHGARQESKSKSPIRLRHARDNKDMIAMIYRSSQLVLARIYQKNAFHTMQ
jgi:hypothetical protein